MKTGYKLHAIQLENITVLKLNIERNLDYCKDSEDQTNEFELSHISSLFTEEDKKVAVKVKAVIGKFSDDDCRNSLYNLYVELLGIFEVDTDRFDIKYIELFCKQNAPLILYPYLKENVYNLTIRCGFDGALLPMFEIPKYKED